MIGPGMACAEALDRLLGAAPEELDDPPADLAEHLAGCPACAGASDAIRRGTRALAGSLDALGESFDEERALRIALEGRRRPAPAAGARSRRRSGGADRWGWVALPLAAAAAFLIAVRGPAPSDPGRFEPPEPSALGATAAPEPFSVRAPADGRVAVFQTRNPKIRVVWLYGSPTAPERE